MNKIWLVARHEFLTNLTRRSYLFSAFILPIFISGVMALSIGFADDFEDGTDQFNPVGVVDLATLTESTPPFEGDIDFVGYADEATALDAFNQGDINGILIIPPDYLQTGAVTFQSDAAASEALRAEIHDYLIAVVGSLAPEGAPIERLQNPAEPQLQLIGEDEPTPIEAAVLRFVLPLIFGFFLTLNILTGSQFMMGGVSEEKENAIIEILMTSVRPTQLIMGKVIGLAGLAFLQLVYLALFGLVAGALTGRLDLLAEARFEPSLLIFGLLYFILQLMLFAGIMIGVGAATSAEQEARQFAAIFVLLAILPPSYGFILFLTNPDSIFVLIMSLFPLTSPLSMMILFGIGEAEAWRIAASLLILLLSVLGTIWLAARVFRVGMLMSGQRLKLRQLAMIFREG